MPRSRSGWLACAAGLGAVVGLLVTAVQVAYRGWGLLEIQFWFNLCWSVPLGLVIGRRFCPFPREPGRAGRFHIRALMCAVAVVGVLLGVGIEAERISQAARRYRQKAINANTVARSFRSGANWSETEETRLTREIALLRALKIPDTLPQSQRDFLTGLDETATPAYRRERYTIIADGLEDIRKFKRPNIEECLQKAAYYDAKAAKYDRVARRPWQPVAPDLPEPR